MLGIVSPVESAFGDCLSCASSECVDAISSWSITVLYPLAGSAFAVLIWQWLRQISPIAVLTTQDLGVDFSATSPWIYGWHLFVVWGLRYTFSPSVNSQSGVSAFLSYCTFDLFLLSAMFSCTTLGHASFGDNVLEFLGHQALIIWSGIGTFLRAALHCSFVSWNWHFSYGGRIGRIGAHTHTHKYHLWY